jgi:ribosomal protein S18 acetylase RimI-like enzyme
MQSQQVLTLLVPAQPAPSRWHLRRRSSASRVMTPVEQLRQARPDDPFVRWQVDPATIGSVVCDGDQVAWTRPDRSGANRWATALGDDPASIASLLSELAGVEPFVGLTVPDDLSDRLDSKWRAPETGHWSFWLMGRPDDLSEVRGAAVNSVLLDSSDPRIDGVLAHSTSAHIYGGDPRIQRWAGVEATGSLLAVAAQTREASGAGHLVSVCSIPEQRGRGLARAVCARLILEAFEGGSPVVFLEMLADNERARSLYQSLGFAEIGQYRSGLLSVSA